MKRLTNCFKVLVYFVFLSFTTSVFAKDAIKEYVFHDTVECLPAGTDGTVGTSGTYVLFGDFPQTVKESDITIDETQSMTMGGFTYYKGSDGYWYVKCIENAFVQVLWDDEEFYPLYSNGTRVAKKSDNKINYFKVEPIKWRVLNPDSVNFESAILMSEMILTADIPFVEPGYLSSDASDWEYYDYSNIRSYLNGIPNYSKPNNKVEWKDKGFLQSAFSASAQEKIEVSYVKNHALEKFPEGLERGASTSEYDEPWRTWLPVEGANTMDKIFLLSVNEVTKEDYGFDRYTKGEYLWGDFRETRELITTDYARANYVRMNIFLDQLVGGAPWWLRSLDCKKKNKAYYVKSNGIVGNVENVTSRYMGIVPALTLKDKLEINPKGTSVIVSNNYKRNRMIDDQVDTRVYSFEIVKKSSEKPDEKASENNEKPSETSSVAESKNSTETKSEKSTEKTSGETSEKTASASNTISGNPFENSGIFEAHKTKGDMKIENTTVEYNGKNYNALSISGNTGLQKSDYSDYWEAACYSNESMKNFLKKGDNIKFKVLGDGKIWNIYFVLYDDNNGTYYSYEFSTKKGKVKEITIPYSKLKYEDWSKRGSFKKNEIRSFFITGRNVGAKADRDIKIFDVEVY